MVAGNLIGTQRNRQGREEPRACSFPLGFPLGLKIGFWFSIAIAVAVVLRRVVALSTPPSPNAPPQLAGLDAYFGAHATLTYVHILCALAFVLLLPLLFWRRTRDSVVLGRVIFPLGIIVGFTAYAMSSHAVGGWLERAAVLFFNTLFLFALYRAWSFTRAATTARNSSAGCSAPSPSCSASPPRAPSWAFSSPPRDSPTSRPHSSSASPSGSAFRSTPSSSNSGSALAGAPHSHNRETCSKGKA